MIWLAIITWAVPVLIAGVTGYWHGRRPAHSLSEFATDTAYMAMLATPLVFVFHMVWLRAIMEADGGVEALGRWSLYWTGLTAIIWGPFMVICYIVRSKRGAA